MRTSVQRLLAIGAVAALPIGVAACGDDDGGTGDAQQEVIDLINDSVGDVDGVDVDADCIEDLASQLSDEDAEAIADAGVDGDPDVSDAAEELGSQLEECISFGE